MSQLREHMRNHMARSVSGDGGGNLLLFRDGRSRIAQHHRSEALDLVYQAADVIRADKLRAAETEAKTLAVAQRAINQLGYAEQQLRSAYEARRTTEARAHTAETAVMMLNARAQELEKLLSEAQSLVSALQTKLSNAELRAENAERQATLAKQALVSVESAIRTQLIGERQPPTSLAAAA